MHACEPRPIDAGIGLAATEVHPDQTRTLTASRRLATPSLR